MLLLREQLTALLGVDPLGREGMTRWARAALAAYRNAVLVDGEEDS